jgi:DNA invertase Pin-like site-specific DNA recombinase
MQRIASLVDQERCCRELAEQKGWIVLDDHIYSDEAKSGTSRAGRTGLEAMLAAAQRSPRPFDYLLVDDTSRLARDLLDVLILIQTLKDCGVEVYFVGQGLDSRDEQSFRMTLSMYGIFDEQHIARLRRRVRTALEGRFLEGYNAGSVPYGYRSVAVLNPDSRAIGRATSSGSKFEIIEDEAIIIRRIFEWLADGHSMFRIVRMLNAEGVPWPHSDHGKWGPDAIKRIAHNEKYRGVNVLGMTSQTKHRQTGKAIKRNKPPEEHLRKELPEIRIVSDDLWNRVAARLQDMHAKQDARRLGGYNRAQDKEYPFSGLLFCGVCERRLRIGGKQGAGVYECPNYRHRGGCTNNFRIRETDAAEQIYNELNDALMHHKASLPADGISRIEDARRACIAKINNIVGALESGVSEALSLRLQTLESEKRQIESQLRVARAAKNSKLTFEGVRALVATNVESLLGVLNADATLSRQVFLKHIGKLSLFPIDLNGKPVYEVIGEIDLFCPPDSSKDGELLGVSGTLTDQQHTVDRYFRFVLTIDVKPDVKCPHVQPLCDLLQARPELSLDPRAPSEWAQLLDAFIPDGPEKPTKLGYGTIARCFWSHRAQWEDRLVVVKTPNPHSQGHLYQVSLIEVEHAVDRMQKEAA